MDRYEYINIYRIIHIVIVYYNFIIPLISFLKIEENHYLSFSKHITLRPKLILHNNLYTLTFFHKPHHYNPFVPLYSFRLHIRFTFHTDIFNQGPSFRFLGSDLLIYCCLLPLGYGRISPSKNIPDL